ncbi:hypothetical protein A1D22_10975 [Pasteurellaceae bacterium LFhippo2]|nr:hypothetical protein [Pasteurellaceae bacterium LFhippo2]
MDFYFEHHENLPITLRHFDLPSVTVRRWIIQYKHFGSSGLAIRHSKKTYSIDFKLNVIQSITTGQFCAEDATIHFGLSNSGIVSQWLKAFLKSGINGLQPKTKGRPSMKPKYAKMPPPPKTEEDRLRLRILELEAENAFLKKLDEIIRRDEAKQRKQSKS